MRYIVISNHSCYILQNRTYFDRCFLIELGGGSAYRRLKLFESHFVESAEWEVRA